MMRKGKKVIGAALSGCMTASMFLTACGDGNEKSGKTEIEILQYKPEAATYLTRWKRNSMQHTMISI